MTPVLALLDPGHPYAIPGGHRSKLQIFSHPKNAILKPKASNPDVLALSNRGDPDGDLSVT